MTEDLIARLKAAHEAATPGPWFKYFDSLAFEGAETADPRTGEPVRGGPEPVYPESSENATLIILVRNNLPEIIAALEEKG